MPSHHLDPYETGGHTNTNRGTHVCTDHHHNLHEGGHTLTHNPQGQWTLNNPGGTTST